MNGRMIAVTPSAYQYPLLIKQLLHAPMMQAPSKEIVYRDLKRLTYAELRDRIGRLASALAAIATPILSFKSETDRRTAASIFYLHRNMVEAISGTATARRDISS